MKGIKGIKGMNVVKGMKGMKGIGNKKTNTTKNKWKNFNFSYFA